MVAKKYCSYCKYWHPLTPEHFVRNRRSPDGWSWNCKLYWRDWKRVRRARQQDERAQARDEARRQARRRQAA